MQQNFFPISRTVAVIEKCIQFCVWASKFVHTCYFFCHMAPVLYVILMAVLRELFCHGIWMWEVAQKLSHGAGIFVVPDG
jgi:hypothetical protein